jgi:mRNA-degrading endonuclease RelE of RelBE toxin-antitoxin system
MKRTWRIEYSRSALRALRKMPRNLAVMIQRKIVALADDHTRPITTPNACRGVRVTGFVSAIGVCCTNWRTAVC